MSSQINRCETLFAHARPADNREHYHKRGDVFWPVTPGQFRKSELYSVALEYRMEFHVPQLFHE